MRTLIAWEPEHLNEVVRLVAYLGSNGVEPGVPDVMTGLPGGSTDPSPPTAPPDSGSGSGGNPGGFPGFMGEYLVRDVGSWYAVEGTQTNDIVSSGGSCSADRATFDWGPVRLHRGPVPLRVLDEGGRPPLRPAHRIAGRTRGHS